MRQVRSLVSAILLAGAIAIPVSASAVGDATYTLASYRTMATPGISPSDRIMAVYMASEARAEMLDRLRDRYPALVW